MSAAVLVAEVRAAELAIREHPMMINLDDPLDVENGATMAPFDAKAFKAGN